MILFFKFAVSIFSLLTTLFVTAQAAPRYKIGTVRMSEAIQNSSYCAERVAFNTFQSIVCNGTLSIPTHAGYTLSAAEVLDLEQKLVWKRCVEGMVFDAAQSNQCNGTPTLYTHEAALILAQSKAGWRLPTRKELSNIVDHSRQKPSIDTTVFPATPASAWSSSPDVGGSHLAWFVDFNYGYVNSTSRAQAMPIRLVRSSAQ